MQNDIAPPGPAPKEDAPESVVQPTEVGSEADTKDLDASIVLDDQKPAATDKKPRFAKLHHFRHHIWSSWSRRRKILVASGAALALIAIIVGVVFAFSGTASAPKQIAKKVAAKPTTVPSPLSGVQVAPALAARPVTAVMIENSDFARPQSGLQDAGVVYEAIAEAGITRFMALFQDTSPQYIGPVRSLRPYYIDFAAPFQASIVHVGGSPDALSEVSGGGFRNLDQFANGSYFTRITARDAPHNVYTSFTQLDQLNQSKGYTSSKFTPWPRKADKKLAAPTAKTIDFAISSSDYYAHYDYDPATNSYARSEGGAPHLDLVSASDTTGVQLKPKVVIALVVPLGQGELDASGAYYSNYTTSGSGQMYVFQDGSVMQGTWTKQDTNSQFQFTDTAGHALALNAGQTWVSLVSAPSQVTYAP